MNPMLAFSPTGIGGFVPGQGFAGRPNLQPFDPSGPPGGDPFAGFDPSGCTLFQVDAPFGLTGSICGPGCRCSGSGINVPGVGAACLGTCVPDTGAPNGQQFDTPISCPGGFEVGQDPITGEVTCVPSRGFEGQPPQPTNGPVVPSNGPQCPQAAPPCNERFVMSGGRCPRRIRQRYDRKTGQWKQVRTMDPENRRANSRAMSRLKVVHSRAKKVIDDFDSFSKPRKRRTTTKKAS